MALLRFAPSPTGALHLGGLRMALFNHLHAKKLGGKWILRIEDTDSTRFVPGSVKGIQSALQWAGLEYDYGPDRAGPHGPYHQSERLDLYNAYATKLLSSGHAYRCFCSVDTLSQMREKFARAGSNQSYDKRCLHLTEEEVARRVRAGERSIIRFNTGAVTPRRPMTDLVFGHLKDAHGSLATDPILLKSDGYPTYHLANVVDDHEMTITHVLRGEEWMTSLPLHLDIYSALGLEPPQYAHIPILLNPDGTKMSKRHGDVKVEDYIRRGWEKDAVLNWLALPGWGGQHDEAVQPEDAHQAKDAPLSTQVMNMDQLQAEFELSALTHRSSSLDPGKLAFLNRQHLLLKAASPEGLTDVALNVRRWMVDNLPLGQISEEYTTPQYIQSVIRMLDSRLVNIHDMVSLAPYLFLEPEYENDEARKMLRRVTPEQQDRILTSVAQALELLDSWTAEELHHCLSEEKLRLNIPTFLPVIRHALTATKDGPPVLDLLIILGRERSLRRIQNQMSDTTLIQSTST
ncbi:unnamed protein product [Mycena citricolor]|uniref:Glutamate--tRNA ligase, mitochondrial n=1 Tax=Mycena citricolor TaxID=2018698 RepID=A0AAD2H525_9AGAR|nr:unnamed protein product [Mycena citricolor]